MATSGGGGGVGLNPDAAAPLNEDAAPALEAAAEVKFDRGLNGRHVDVRHQWARKVFGVLGCEYISMVGIAALVMMEGEAWVKASPDMAFTLVIASCFGVLSMLLSFIVLPASMLKRFPDNFVLLCAFTCISGVAVGLGCLRFNLDSLLVGLGISSFIVAALSAFACQTTFDFLGCVPYIFVTILLLSAFQSMLSLGDELHMYDSDAVGGTFKVRALERTCGSALCVLLFIVFDVQLIMKGYHYDKIGPEDFLAAAVQMHVDPILLILYFLRCGKRDK